MADLQRCCLARLLQWAVTYDTNVRFDDFARGEHALFVFLLVVRTSPFRLLPQTLPVTWTHLSICVRFFIAPWIERLLDLEDEFSPHTLPSTSSPLGLGFFLRGYIS